jgi:hypothetical protein
MRVVLEFFRGPRDGQVLVGDPDAASIDEASALYCALINDLGDDRLWVTSEYAVRILRTSPLFELESAIAVGCRFPGHVYQLIDSCCTSSEIHLRLIHYGPAE